MSTDVMPTRTNPPAEKLSPSFMVALALHAGLIAGFAGWAFLHASETPWGEQNAQAGAIQASMVSALPLPPKQRFDPKSVLTSEKPSPAPTPPKPRAEPVPKPNEVLLPVKAPPKPAKANEKPAPDPPKHPQPVPDTPKATTGETPGIRIPQSITQMKNGTASLTVEERSFGDRYAYYVRLIAQRINQSKSEGEADPPETRGKRAVIEFTIDHDGTPVNASVVTRSGSAALDTSTLRAIQRIESFGPLPQGDHITIHFEYDSH